jgi:hypothetical protein
MTPETIGDGLGAAGQPYVVEQSLDGIQLLAHGLNLVVHIGLRRLYLAKLEIVFLQLPVKGLSAAGGGAGAAKE